MQELFPNVDLAHLAKRTYALQLLSYWCHPGPTSCPPSGLGVFENYTWDITASGDYSIFNGKRISLRVPLTALLFGASLSPHILCAPHSTLQPRPSFQRLVSAICGAS